MPTHQEIWKSIPGWEGFYEVSNLGQIRTISRPVPCKNGHIRKIRQLIRKQGDLKDGYKIIVLSRNGQLTCKTVHTIVLETFVGPRPPNMEACHYDGNKANNILSNLRWDTKKANAADSVRLGTRPNPKRTHCNYGHELSESNIYYTRARPNTRQCRQCRSVYNARARAKRKITLVA